LIVNGRSDFCAPLKAFDGKEETGKAPENGMTNRPDAEFRTFGMLRFIYLWPIFPASQNRHAEPRDSDLTGAACSRWRVSLA
jgi:hypothetical protein